MKTNCKNNEWDIRLKTKKKPTFKAGSELADKVNIMQVEIDEQENEVFDTLKLDLVADQEENSQFEFKLKKKTRFKASGDLTEKVNVMHIDFSELEEKDSETSEIKMKLQQNKNELLVLSVKKKSKPRFKPGSDLTEKVNLVAVDLIEELIDDLEVCTFSIKLKSSACLKEEKPTFVSEIQQ